MTDLLTAAEASARLGVKDFMIRLWIHRGRMVGVKRGRDWFVTSAEVERMKERRASLSDARQRLEEAESEDNI